ncbi:rpom-1, partial [Pristionchus pacificus]
MYIVQFSRGFNQSRSVSVLSAVSKVEGKRKIKKDNGEVKDKKIKNWEDSALDRLEKELKEAGARYSRLQERRGNHSKLMEYAMKEDVSGIVSLAEATCGSRRELKWIQEERDQGCDMDMLMSLCLLVSSRIIGREMKDEGKVRSAAYGLANIVSTLRNSRPGEDTKASLILLWDSLYSLGDESINEILEETRPNLIKLIRSVDLKSSRVIMKENEKIQVRNRLLEWKINETDGEMTDDQYDSNLSLVDRLRTPMSFGEYLGNPYSIESLEKDELKMRFDRQMERDSKPWLEVPNVFLNEKSSLCSAEELIDTWEWKKEIEKVIKRKLAKKSGNHHVRNLLSNLDPTSTSEGLHKAVLSALGQGQSLLSLGSFQQSLAMPILSLSHSSFITTHRITDEQTMSDIFTDYSNYFTDTSISRVHSHREWWNICARKRGLDPTFDTPLHTFDNDSIIIYGEFVLEVVLEACEFPRGPRGTKTRVFSTKSVTQEEESLLREEGRIVSSKMLAIDPSLLKLLSYHQFRYLVFPCWQLPMEIPPRPWLDRGMAGPLYTTQNAAVVRNLPEFPKVDMGYEMRNRLKHKGQGRPVFDALNCLGSTGWTINRPVLDVLKKLFVMSNDPEKKGILANLSIPSKGDIISIPDSSKVVTQGKVDGVFSIEDKEKWREFYRQKEGALKEKNELNSLWYWMLYRLVLAEYFSSSTLFFPHNMDFRGRVYPISPLLNHMGDDVNRSILKFARGKTVGARGLSWLKLHCINLTGKLKRQSVEERMKVAEESVEKMIDSADRPLDGDRWWMESEEPWQTLAACIEVRDALRSPDPELFVSHLPIHQDGSCNGLQHYAALGRDRGGGSEVNLLPAPFPADVYSSVAVRVEEKRKIDETNGVEIALRLREKLKEPVPRKVIKQTVMTTVYGVTMYGAVQQIKRQLKALGMDGEEAAEFASYLAKHTFASLSDAFASSMQLKDWLRQCARGIGELMRPVEWVTPLGLPVMQPYTKSSRKKGKLVMMPITSKQENAYPPNLVHSLDSTHMMLTALHVSHKGLTFAAVHDCFWTHAADVDVMGVVCREQFVALHQEDLVKGFSGQMKDSYLPFVSEEEDKKKFDDLFSPKV